MEHGTHDLERDRSFDFESSREELNPHISDGINMAQPEPNKGMILKRGYKEAYTKLGEEVREIESEDGSKADEDSVHIDNGRKPGEVSVKLSEDAEVEYSTKSDKRSSDKVIDVKSRVAGGVVSESSTEYNEVKNFETNEDEMSDQGSDSVYEYRESPDDVTEQVPSRDGVQSELKPEGRSDDIDTERDGRVDNSAERMAHAFKNGSSKDDLLTKEMCVSDYMWKAELPLATATTSLAATLASSMADGEIEPSLNETKTFSKWYPPSIPIAVEFRKRTLFREGSASLWATDLSTAEDLSGGVALYFEFARSSCICMFILSVLSVPSIVFSFSGSRIPIGDRDALGFFQFTIGNIGYDPTSPSYKADSTCLHQPSSYNGTCISVLGGEVKLADAQTVMSTLEFLQIAVFFIFIFRLSRRSSIILKHEEEDCKIGDYSVMCRRLPRDTTVADLRRHFDSLYPLDKPDWAKRRPIKHTRVVQKCENSGESSFIGTWVADCVVFSAIGKGLSAFKLHQDWTVDLLRSRAMVNMYSHDTCHSAGPNIVNKLQAEIVMKKVEKKIAMLTEQLDKHKEKLIDIHQVPDLEAQDMLSQKLKLTSRADAVAGFVTFEYSECMRRCVEDYGYYNSFPRNLLFYPSKLKLKGQRIKVERAPDPGEMIWEHLEVSRMSKRLKRIGTALLSLVLLIVSFIAILQASIYKSIFSARIPSGGLCSATIPALYGAYSNNTDYKDFKIIRPNAAQRFQLDSACDAVVPGSFYAVYSTANNISSPVSLYSLQACDSSVATPSNYYKPTGSSGPISTLGGTCPHYGQKVFCPCISKKSSTETCRSAACASSSSSSSSACTTFLDTTLSACYCQQMLNSYLKSGVLATLRYLGTISASTAPDSCSTYFTDYSTAQGVSYGTILSSILVNGIVIFGMKRLCTFESHVSVDRGNASLMIKLFLFTYTNMAFTVLIAFGRIGNLPVWLQKLYIFQGQYSDFSSNWYTTAGVYFLTAFFIKAVIDTAMKLGMFYVVVPIMRCLTYPAIRKMSSHRVVTQYELNHMLVGPVFDTSINYAHFLSMFFFAMTYATGLPIMMPMAFAALTVVFLVDRLMLLRFNQKPPQMGDEVMQIILKVLPFAGIIRLAFGCWMYSSPDIFGVSLSTPLLDYYNEWLSYIKTKALVWLTGSGSNTSGKHVESLTKYALERLFKANVFPLLLLLVTAIIAAAVQILWKFLPFFWIEKVASFITKLLWRPFCVSNKIHADSDDSFLRSSRPSNIRVLRLNAQALRHSAPFTGEYFCYLPKFFLGARGQRGCCDGGVKEQLLTRMEMLHTANKDRSGWVYMDSTALSSRDERYSAYKVKKWLNRSSVDGLVRQQGDSKTTFEIIQDTGCSSYALEKIPGYELVIKGFKEGNFMVGGLQRN
jgi:hypothetical protein